MASGASAIGAEEREVYGRIRENLKRLEGSGWFLNELKSFPVDNCGQAAVLVVLQYREDGALHVLLTKRSGRVAVNKGDAAFPGGKFDAQLDRGPVENALREAQEEIGLDPAAVDVVSVLPPSLYGGSPTSKTRLAVTPVVCTLNTREVTLTANEEVSDIFWVPLQSFLDSTNHHAFKFMWPEHRFIGSIVHCPDSATKETKTVWGLTAAIAIAVAAMATNRMPAFPFTALALQHKGGNSYTSNNLALTQRQIASKL